MTEHIFYATGPGQAAETVIGGIKYVRGCTYTDVPAGHVGRGGFVDASVPLPAPLSAVDAPGCIVLGSAPGWADDIEDARKYAPDWPIVAVNGVGTLVEDDITVWVSVHGRDLVKWMPMRAERGFNTDYTAYGNFADADADGGAIRWNRPNSGGSSGLHAVELALEMEYKRIILCGMPLDGQERVRSLDGITVEGVCAYQAYHDAWEKAESKLRDRVKSMSGWTKKLLGKPTKGWSK